MSQTPELFCPFVLEQDYIVVVFKRYLPCILGCLLCVCKDEVATTLILINSDVTKAPTDYLVFVTSLSALEVIHV